MVLQGYSAGLQKKEFKKSLMWHILTWYLLISRTIVCFVLGSSIWEDENRCDNQYLRIEAWYGMDSLRIINYKMTATYWLNRPYCFNLPGCKITWLSSLGQEHRMVIWIVGMDEISIIHIRIELEDCNKAFDVLYFVSLQWRGIQMLAQCRWFYLTFFYWLMMMHSWHWCTRNDVFLGGANWRMTWRGILFKIFL